MIKIHSSAEVSSKAIIGDGTCIWNGSQIRDGAVVGKNCIIGKDVYIDTGVTIGNNVKIQNNVLMYCGLSVEDGVFVGPGVVFTNDKYPRAIKLNGELKTKDDWEISNTLIKKGASLGANSTILPGITIGKFAMIGSGSVVTKDVVDFGLVCGNPAVLLGFVCECGKPLKKGEKHDCNK